MAFYSFHSTKKERQRHAENNEFERTEKMLEQPDQNDVPNVTTSNTSLKRQGLP